MTALSRLAIVMLLVPAGACLAIDPPAAAERTVTRTFTVQPHARLHVELHGGAIAIDEGSPGSIRVDLMERVRAGTDRDIEAALADYEISAGQQGDTVAVVARRRQHAGGWTFWQDFDRVHVSARLVVPADVQLDLTTSGGSIAIKGEHGAPLTAHTSGGAISVDEGRAEMDLGTSGGSIRVNHAMESLSAHTSGGSITVGYVGAGAREVDLGTSGGSISVGVDPAASLRFDAGTSGGGVHVSGFEMTMVKDRSHASGQINGGAGLLQARTSGGSITIEAKTKAP